ncbi:Motile sperm domain-containing protein 1-like [Oopsacas minuta]|uniref:Motile sperm domain-containing protein 1-like n=1 Tax=Oopsacas minuta TaxID=111878 RepID=A0AAV7K0V1_9METZ|nr:Motile sperm domain-containing protein 1-like [Oopsacas minuta]
MDSPDESLHSVRSTRSNTGPSYVVEHRKARHQGREAPSANGSLKGGLIPVILSSDKLVFNREQCEKNLTLYNPFDFEIHYKLYTTAPRKYTVRNAEGSVKPHFCVEIAIIRRSIEENITGYADNFLMKIFSNQACIGKKDVPVFININEDSIETEAITTGKNGTKSKITKKGNKPGLLNKKIPWLPIALTTVSLAVLAFSLEEFPSYNPLNYNHKLIAAFLIGKFVTR